MGELADRVRELDDRIAAAGGDPARVRVVAVTKGFDAGVATDAVAAGLVDLGESYVQELAAKASQVPGEKGLPAPRWHFVGRLQRNKVRMAARYVSIWHSVDRIELGREIARRAPGATVLAQVNFTGESTKGGCSPPSAPALVSELGDLGLNVVGLMTVGPLGPPEAARPAFSELRRLAGRLGLAELSMGMSNDLEVAVQEGATMVRVGTALFGPRPGSSEVRH